MLTGCNFLPYPTTMLLLVVTTFGKLGPSAQGFLQSLADVACSTGVVDRLVTRSWFVAEDRSAVLGFVGVALCSVTIIRVWLKVLGKTFVMVKGLHREVLMRHSSECG